MASPDLDNEADTETHELRDEEFDADNESASDDDRVSEDDSSLSSYENEEGLDDDEEEAGEGSAKPRVAGGRVPLPKPINPIFDEEDQMLFDLKLQGYTNEETRQKLVSQGFTDYKPSSIYSRFARLRQKMQEHTEELIEKGVTDWQPEEEEELLQAYEIAEARVDQEVADIQGRLFHYVAQSINSKVLQPRFTANSCQIRYEKLLEGVNDGTDEDNDVAVVRQADLSRRKEAYLARKQTEIALDRTRIKTRAEKERQAREAQKSTLTEEKEARLRARQQSKNERVEERKRHMENKRKVLEIYKQELATEQARKEEQKRDLEMLAILEEGGGVDWIDGEEEADGATPTTDMPSTSVIPSKRPADAGDNSQQGRPATAPNSMVVYQQSPLRVPGPEDAFSDPREIMAKGELLSLVCERGMTKNREKETKGLLNRRIRESDRTARLDDIKTWLTKRGLSLTGNRADMLWRLAEYDATRSRSWRPKHMAVLDRGRRAVQHLFSSAANGPTVLLPRPTMATRTG